MLGRYVLTSVGSAGPGRSLGESDGAMSKGKQRLARVSTALVVAMAPLALTSVSQPAADAAQSGTPDPAPVANVALSPLGIAGAALSDQIPLGSTTAVAPQQIARQVTIEGTLDLNSNTKVELDSPKGKHVWAASALADHDVPAAAMRAYKHAAATMAKSKPGCHISWSLLAGIGRVESDHGRFAGSVLGTDGVSRPAIIGLPLNGVGPVAAIRDTDKGAWDGDPVWDRAVGPMQFIPSTWTWAGRDGDGDGVRNPNDIDDAALAAASYLCGGSGDLRTAAGMSSAIFRYNPSNYYVSLVRAFASGYQSGAFVIPSPPAPKTEATTTVHPVIAPKDQPKSKGPAKAKHHANGHHHASKPPESGSGSTPSPKPSSKPSPMPSSKPSPKPSSKPSPKPSPTPSPTHHP